MTLCCVCRDEADTVYKGFDKYSVCYGCEDIIGYLDDAMGEGKKEVVKEAQRLLQESIRESIREERKLERQKNPKPPKPYPRLPDGTPKVFYRNGGGRTRINPVWRKMLHDQLHNKNKRNCAINFAG